MNPITTLTNSTASGAVAEATNLMSGDIGYLVYFVIGLAVITLVISTVLYFVRKRG